VGFLKNVLKERSDTMNFICGVFAGLVIGAIITVLLYPSKKTVKPSGSFVIDFSDPLKDICRLELDESLETIYEKDQMILRVVKSNDSQN
jgi:gas vesicle protein